MPFDWRVIVNGYLDQMLYEHGVDRHQPAVRGGPAGELSSTRAPSRPIRIRRSPRRFAKA